MLAFLLDPAALSGPADGASDMHPTRQRLISVATRLFQQRGYHAIGLAEILALSETPKGSLYHHFPGGKPELAEACVTRIAESSLAAIDRLSGSGLDMIGFLRRLAEGTAAWLQRTAWTHGRGVPRARDMAATIIAAQEGALVLARSRHDAAPVTLVTDMLCTMVDRG